MEQIHVSSDIADIVVVLIIRRRTIIHNELLAKLANTFSQLQLKKHIDKMVASNVIEPSEAAYHSQAPLSLHVVILQRLSPSWSCFSGR